MAPRHICRQQYAGQLQELDCIQAHSVVGMGDRKAAHPLPDLYACAPSTSRPLPLVELPITLWYTGASPDRLSQQTSYSNYDLLHMVVSASRSTSVTSSTKAHTTWLLESKRNHAIQVWAQEGVPLNAASQMS